MITVWLLLIYMKAYGLRRWTHRNLFTYYKWGRKPCSFHGFCMRPVFCPTTSVTRRFQTWQTIGRVFEAATLFRSHESRHVASVCRWGFRPRTALHKQATEWTSLVWNTKKVKSTIFFCLTLEDLVWNGQLHFVLDFKVKEVIGVSVSAKLPPLSRNQVMYKYIDINTEKCVFSCCHNLLPK